MSPHRREHGVTVHKSNHIIKNSQPLEFKKWRQFQHPCSLRSTSWTVVVKNMGKMLVPVQEMDLNKHKKRAPRAQDALLDQFRL